MSMIIPMTKHLRRQLTWWLETLRTKNFTPSKIWFRDEHQPSVFVQSDASGDSGFGFCAAGLHVTGMWRKDLEEAIDNDMFTKELLPVAIAILLLADHFHGHVFGLGGDNSGSTSRLNCGSCRCPLGHRLIRNMHDKLFETDCHMLADWNNREQPHALHADDLSKVLTPLQWSQHYPDTSPAWVFDLIIHHRGSGQVRSAAMRIPRIGEVIPAHLRHRR